jgi:ubiquinone/menaquinone biosynthesis C-methylase UbiE
MNAEQTLRWNGESGLRWVSHRERHQAEHQNLVPWLFQAAAIAPGDRVLDIGCGCGQTTITAARAAGGLDVQSGRGGAGVPAGQGGPAVPGGCAVGVDLSTPMLAEARRLTREAGDRNVAFVRADAQACPLRRDSCDVMISSFGVMFFDDPAAAFSSIAAAVRSGGRLAFLCWRPDAENEVFAIPQRALNAIAPESAPARDDLFADPERVSALLAGAGWTGVRADPVTQPAWIGSDVDDVIGYVRGMEVVRRIAAAAAGDDRQVERALAAMAGEYAARQAPDGVWVEAAAWLVTARRS